MNAIEESLKSARLLHRATLGLSAGIILLSFSPNTAKLYREANVELGILSQRLTDIGTRVERWADSVLLDSVLTVDSLLSGLLTDDIRASDKLDLSKRLWKPAESRELASPAKLIAIRSFVAANYRPAIIRPNWAATQDILRDELASHCPCVLLQIDFTRGDDGISLFVQTRSSGTGVKDSSGGYEENLWVPVDTVRIDNTTSSRWWTGVASPLILTDRAEPMIFPRLSAVWNEVENFEIAAAETVLLQKQAEHQQSVDVFGFSVDERAALFVGPAALLGILVYLMVHIGHIARLKERYPNDSLIQDFPWAPLVSKQFGLTVDWFAIVVFPPLAMFLLFRRFLGENSDLLLLPAIYAALLGIAIGVAYRTQIRKVTQQYKRGS